VRPLTCGRCTAGQARSSGEAAGSGGREADLTGEANNAPPARNDGDGPWMGSADLWMGLAGLSMCFLFFVFFYAINRGGQITASEKILFTVTFRPGRL
jgi:hypothetical protein